MAIKLSSGKTKLRGSFYPGYNRAQKPEGRVSVGKGCVFIWAEDHCPAAASMESGPAPGIPSGVDSSEAEIEQWGEAIGPASDGPLRSGGLLSSQAPGSTVWAPPLPAAEHLQSQGRKGPDSTQTSTLWPRHFFHPTLRHLVGHIPNLYSA